MIMVVKNFISDHVQYSSLWSLDMALIRIQNNSDKEALECNTLVYVTHDKSLKEGLNLT
jgi:hypothetical protein